MRPAGELIGTGRCSEPIRCQSWTIHRPIISISTRIICISIERVVGDQAVGEPRLGVGGGEQQTGEGGCEYGFECFHFVSLWLLNATPITETKGRELVAPFLEAPRSALGRDTPSRAEWRVP